MRKTSLTTHIKRLLEGALAWIFYYVFRALPVDASSAILGALARAVGSFIPVSHVARVNLSLAFPEKTAVEKEHILRGCWENLGRVVGEFPHLKALSGRATVKGMEHVEAIKQSGKSAIVFSGHLGNWEVFGAMAQQLGMPISLVYRPANNPYTEALYCHSRKNIARGLYPKNREGAKQILKGIRNGELFGMLVDQKMNDGIEVPFFGHPAMTAKAIAEFALRHDVPIYPGRIIRHNGAQFTFEILPPMQLPKSDNHSANVLELLTSINQLLEQWIREYPEQWFWLHRRWPKPLYQT